MIAEPPRETLAVLRRAYPAGLPAEDYRPLLIVLYDDFSDRNLAQLMAAFTGGEPVVIDNDAADAVTSGRPPAAEVARVRALLVAAGYRPGSADISP